ncbi:MAG: orotidine-5'-phosphate decarboxylase [Bacillota bacterium]|nr:orotidine-5'-phosphate decarboxylase [Bacillota bacterium]
MIVDRLYERVEENGHVCLGLDTDYSYIPKWFAESFKSKGEAIYNFNKEIIDKTYDSVACFKVQIAYYEALGLEGMKAYKRTLDYIKEKDTIVISDIKRGDIFKTAEMYAQGHFEGDFESDYLTLNSYMGLNDSIEPFLPYLEKDNKGVFVLIRTSNKGANDFQYIKNSQGEAVYEIVGEKVNQLAEKYIGKYGFSSLGGVVGCTNNEESKKLRSKIKNLFLLIPGFGAQGGGAKDVVPYLIKGNGGIVNSSRGLLLAYKNKEEGYKNFAEESKSAVINMRDSIIKELK